MNTRRFLLSLLALPLASACSEVGSGEPRGVSIQVAPLQLDGIGDARWRVAVASAEGPLWSRDLSSTEFGDGQGSLAYVGPCDANANPHTVTLTLLELRDSGGGLLASPGDFKDPGPMTRSGVTCASDADVAVAFDVTLLRAANQGFFDVAVNFDDVFCSAKLDCLPELLLDASGVRGPTVVMALSCTSGPDTPTYLYLSDVTLTCVDADPDDGVVLAPVTRELSLASEARGQQGPVPPLLYQWASYSGEQQAGGADAIYWNHAFGLALADIGERRCTFAASGTASSSELVGGQPPAGEVWPVIDWQVEVLDGEGALCLPQALDAPGSGLQTRYLDTSGGDAPSFAARYSNAGSVAPIGITCQDADDAVFRATTVGGQAAVSLTVDGIPSDRPYRLPAGATLGDSCCVDACCTL